MKGPQEASRNALYHSQRISSGPDKWNETLLTSPSSLARDMITCPRTAYDSKYISIGPKYTTAQCLKYTTEPDDYPSEVITEGKVRIHGQVSMQDLGDAIFAKSYDGFVPPSYSLSVPDHLTNSLYEPERREFIIHLGGNTETEDGWMAGECEMSSEETSRVPEVHVGEVLRSMVQGGMNGWVEVEYPVPIKDLLDFWLKNEVVKGSDGGRSRGNGIPKQGM